jgi:hypothetical protein
VIRGPGGAASPGSPGSRLRTGLLAATGHRPLVTMLASVTATMVYGFAAAARHSEPTAADFQVPLAGPRCQYARAGDTGQVLRFQATLNASPPVSAEGCASTLPEPSTIVISSSLNVEITPDFEPDLTLELPSVQVWKSESG